MKTWILALAGTGLMAAQNPNSASSYLGQTWVGLLVSSSCQGSARYTSASEEANRTVSDRVTTPAVDNAGTRGSSEPGENVPSAKGDIPQTGDLSVRDNKKIKDAGWREARRQASTLNSTCRVSAETRTFALLLPDGSLLRFDDLANSKIAGQLGMRVSAGTAKILRVQVVGKLQTGMIALDEIQM